MISTFTKNGSIRGTCFRTHRNNFTIWKVATSFTAATGAARALQRRASKLSQNRRFLLQDFRFVVDMTSVHIPVLIVLGGITDTVITLIMIPGFLIKFPSSRSSLMSSPSFVSRLRPLLLQFYKHIKLALTVEFRIDRPSLGELPGPGIGTHRAACPKAAKSTSAK